MNDSNKENNIDNPETPAVDVVKKQEKENRKILKNLRDIPPDSRPRLNPGISLPMAIFILLIVAGIIFAFYYYPVMDRNRILNDSSIEYQTTFAPDTYKDINLTYKVRARNQRVELTASWEHPEIGPIKEVTGKIDADRYMDLYYFLDQYEWAQTNAQDDYDGKITLGKKEMLVKADKKQKKFLDIKFDILKQKYGKKEAYINEADTTKMWKLASNVDFRGQLAAPYAKDFLLFNKADGTLAGILLKNEKEVTLGKYQLVASNENGLGLAVEYDEGLIFWEKQYVANHIEVLAEEWETDTRYQNVFITYKSNVFFTRPTENGKHELMNYNYADRKLTTLLPETDNYLKAISNYGTYLLLISPEEDNFEIYSVETGEMIKEIDTALKKEAGKIISFVREDSGFSQPPTKLLMVDGNRLFIKDFSGEEYDIVSSAPGEIVPLHVNFFQQSLIFTIKNTNIYYITNIYLNQDRQRAITRSRNSILEYPPTSNSDKQKISALQINKNPVIMHKPRLSRDYNRIYFFRLDDVFEFVLKY